MNTNNDTKQRNDAPLERRAATPETANAPTNELQGHPLSGWRKYFKPHPAALAFNRFTTDDDRRKLEKDIEKHGLQQPIVTASVAGEDKVYVVDGISRLDALEALGREIVNERGEWIGTLAGAYGRSNVIHHHNFTHESIRHLVISLNARRRHQTKEELARAIAEAIETERKDFSASDGQKLRKADEKGISCHDEQKFKSKRGRGRPQDPLRAKVTTAAAAAGVEVSESTVRRALAKSKPQPKPKKERCFEDRVWAKWAAFVNNVLKKNFHQQHRDALLLIADWAKEGGQVNK